MQLIQIQQSQRCSWETSVIWRISETSVWRKAKVLQSQKDCFSWKHRHWTRQMSARLLRLLFARFITMSAGKSWIRTHTKQSYRLTGFPWSMIALMDQSRQEDPTLVVPGERICLILKIVQTVGILKVGFFILLSSSISFFYVSLIVGFYKDNIYVNGPILWVICWFKLYFHVLEKCLSHRLILFVYWNLVAVESFIWF